MASIYSATRSAQAAASIIDEMKLIEATYPGAMDIIALPTCTTKGEFNIFLENTYRAEFEISVLLKVSLDFEYPSKPPEVELVSRKKLSADQKKQLLGRAKETGARHCLMGEESLLPIVNTVYKFLEDVEDTQYRRTH